jgi:Lectin C-type domain
MALIINTINFGCTGNFKENFWTSGNAEGFWKYDFHWDSTGRLYRQYLNWAVGQPDSENSPGPGNCIMLSYVDGFKWHDADCQSEKLRYICEQKGKRHFR